MDEKHVNAAHLGYIFSKTDRMLRIITPSGGAIPDIHVQGG